MLIVGNEFKLYEEPNFNTHGLRKYVWAKHETADTTRLKVNIKTLNEDILATVE